MTNATLTKPNPAKVAARTTGAPRVVAADSTAKQHAAARRAAEQLADALDSVKHAGDNVIVARYGADIDLSAVRLAKRAADELAGNTKSRGGARADVLAVLDALTSVDALTDATFVAAARARLDANAADKRARRDRKQALAAQVNDKSASVAARRIAIAAGWGPARRGTAST